MKNRFFLVVSIIFFVFSCSKFVNLGDKSYDGADNTEGLPDELYESDAPDTEASPGDYDDWNEDSADSDYYDEGSQDEWEDNEQNAPYPDEDYADSNYPDPESDTDNSDPWAEPTDPAYVFPESNPFPEGFSNADCNCAYELEYEPVCCNGIISVFNSCFANCYAKKSSNKICTVYNPGLCDGYENSDDDVEETPGNDNEESDQDIEIVDDNDTDEADDADAEIPDSDADAEVAGCGCYPEEEAAIFRCGESFYFITECLATCHCENPQKLFL
ncbi:hypothetical protein IKO70_02430 [bacterium]|nr:hypothetical protein [bacterium]